MSNFNPGFRLSLTDIIALITGAVISITCYSVNPLISLIIFFVVLHFFLFCNVIRMSRIPELIWASFFTALISSSLHFGQPSLEAAFIISLLATLTLVGLESKKPGYHGVFWQKFNPNLMQWFEQKHRH